MSDDTSENHLSPDEARARDALRSASAPILDDVTRRRVVRRALDASGSRSRRGRWTWIGAAAAVVVAIVAVVALLQPGDGSQTATVDEAGEGSSQEPTSGDALDELAEVGVEHLGAFETDEELLGVVLALTPITFQSDAEDARSLTPSLPSCADVLDREFVPESYATATFRSTEVIVLVGTIDAQTRAVYLLDVDTCAPLDGWAPRLA